MTRAPAVAVLLFLATAAVPAQVRTADVSVAATEAQRIFVGTISSITPRAAESPWGDSLIYSDLEIDVLETLKGDPSPTATVTVPGGALGAVALRASSWPQMSRGDRAVYFVNRSASGEWMPHRQGQGILTLDAADVVQHSDVSLEQVRALVHDAWHGGSPPVTYTYRVVDRFPHDASAFTQGLALHDDVLYEGTGLLGASSLRQVDLRTGTVVRRVELPPQHFGEGITIFNRRIYQLTWLSGVGFIYDLATLEKIGEFLYAGEGWGLTHDDAHLIMSDGTSALRFLDPSSLQTVRTIHVTDGDGAPVVLLNELEYVNGQILANVWQTDRLARIDPASGRVTGWIDLHGLLPAGTSADVLNGIAFDRLSGRLFVTGKLWPWLFQIALDPVR